MFGLLVAYFEYFDLINWFEIWLGGASDLRVVCWFELLAFQHRVVLVS